MIRWSQDADGIVTLTLDDPDRSANAMNAAYVREMGEAVERLERERDTVTGVIVTSAKDTFLVGMDLKEFTSGGLSGASADSGGGLSGASADSGGGLSGASADGAAVGLSTDSSAGVDVTDRRAFSRAVTAAAAVVKDQFRRLERLGRPVVAALNGTALGGGFEVALACHHRIAVDDPKARFGLPEVTLGLLPGGGGVTRVVRMLGVQEALTRVLGEGPRLRPTQARDLGLVDELVDDPADLLPRAVAWVRANPNAAQPWDRSGYRIPGGRPTDKQLAQMLPAFPANLRKQLKGAQYPAPHHILCAAVEGAAVDFDTALRIEARWFADLVGSPIQRNMTSAFFFDLQHLNRGGSRPSQAPPFRAKRVGVIGAGMMGAGIAYACARVGVEVVLVDTTLQAAERGKAYSVKLLDKAVARGRSTQAKRDATLARITPTDALTDVAGCDVVIEAVFEDLTLKHDIFRRLNGIVGPDTLLTSNTSSLPITSLAEAVEAPERFCGLHFFSPVERMPLVEIIRGRGSGDEALARAYDLVRQLDKTPIVVNDSRGFFTSRVFGIFVLEGVAMVGEGVPAASIEQAAAQAGYPVGPLAVTDEVSLGLAVRVRNEARKAGEEMPRHPGEAVLERMVEEFGRAGKAAGAGFYEYPKDGPKRLWPGLAGHFGTGCTEPVPFADLKERLLFGEALEAVKCLDEGVLTAVPDGNIGSIFGIGFPPWTGGVLQYVDQYTGGVKGFVARADELADRYGERFRPSEPLRARAERGEPVRVAPAF